MNNIFAMSTCNIKENSKKWKTLIMYYLTTLPFPSLANPHIQISLSSPYSPFYFLYQSPPPAEPRGNAPPPPSSPWIDNIDSSLTNIKTIWDKFGNLSILLCLHLLPCPLTDINPSGAIRPPCVVIHTAHGSIN